MVQRLRRVVASRLPQLIALLTACAAAVNLASALGLAINGSFVWVEGLYPLGVESGRSRLVAACSAFLLAQLSVGLARRKRLAWLLAAMLLAISALHQQLVFAHAPEAWFCLLVLLLLVIGRRLFVARSDQPSVRHGLLVLVAALLFTALYGWLGFFWLDQRAGVVFQPLAVLQHSLGLFIEDVESSPSLASRAGQQFAASIHAIGLLTLGYALLQLLRPVMQRPKCSSAAQERLRPLVARHGRLPLAPLALQGEKQVLFSASGASALVYGVRGRGAVALGDPMGPMDEVGPLIEQFRRLCALNDWTPAVYQAHPEMLELYQAQGWRSLCIGEDAVVELEAFRLQGALGKRLRPPVNRFQRLGYQVEVLRSFDPAAMVRLLSPVNDQWLARIGGREKCFSLGCFGEQALEQAWLGLLRDSSARVVAFVTLNVRQGDHQAALDMMRSLADVPSGAMDALLVGVILELQRLGLQRFNLGLCPLRGLTTSACSSLEQRALARLAQVLERSTSLKGLEAFKQKFQPSWEPRHLVYASRTNLSEVITALMRLEFAGVVSPLRWWRHPRLNARPPAPSRSPSAPPRPSPRG